MQLVNFILLCNHKLKKLVLGDVFPNESLLNEYTNLEKDINSNLMEKGNLFDVFKDEKYLGKGYYIFQILFNFF